MMRQALRRAMACFLLAAVLSTAAVIPASAAGFRDVPSGHWADVYKRQLLYSVFSVSNSGGKSNRAAEFFFCCISYFTS